MTNKFKLENTLESRKSESARILDKYKDKIPIILELTDNIKIDKKKFLLMHDMCMSQFAYIIRKRINLKPEEAMFIFINDKIIPYNTIMSTIYNENKDVDGFLYATVSLENTFGYKTHTYHI